MGSYNDFYNITPRVNATYNEVFYSSKLPDNPRREKIEKNDIKPFKYFSNDALSNKKCIIVIPVYKQEQTEFEIVNMTNTVNKFRGKYPMLLLCHNDIKTSLFNIKYDYDFSYIKLSKLNFLNKNTYSFLLERPSYYEMFSNWEYQMIVQMDVWIFGDGYDIDKFFGYTYVGAPWNEKYVKKTFDLAGVELAGNGGLSLRNNKQLAEYLRNSKFKDNKYKTVED